MRVLLLSFVIFPVFTNGQINRSATEFAKEKIQEYVTTKLFKDKSYQPVGYGELKPRKEKNSDAIWSITHRFQISEPITPDKKKPVSTLYSFMFYFNEKMKVIRAETFYAD